MSSADPSLSVTSADIKFSVGNHILITDGEFKGGPYAVIKEVLPFIQND